MGVVSTLENVFFFFFNKKVAFYWKQIFESRLPAHYAQFWI